MNIIGYTKAKVDALLGTKADLINGDVPDSQLPDRLADSALRAAFVPFWSAAEVVAQGAFRLAPDGTVIQRNTAGTTRSSYDATEAALWTVKTSSGGGNSYSDEQARDAIGTALRGGGGVAVTVDDNGDIITIGLPDGSITPAKLSFDPATQAELDAAVVGSATTISSAGTAQTLTAQTGTAVYDLTLTAATCALTITGGVAGKPSRVHLRLRQDATGGRLVTFPGNVTFPLGLTPVLSTLPGGLDLFELLTTDGGTSFTAAFLGPDAGPLFTQAAGDARYVRTVNNTTPDGAGNVTVAGGGGGGSSSSGLGATDMGSLKALTIDPRLTNSNKAMVVGVLGCWKAKGIAGAIATSLRYYVQTAIAGGSGFAIYFAIYDETGTQLAVTANVAGTAPFTAGDHQVTLPTFTMPISGTVIIAILINAAGTAPTTLPALTSGPGVTVALTWGQDGSKGYPSFAYGSALTAPPASLTLNSTNCVIGNPGTGAVLLALQ